MALSGNARRRMQIAHAQLASAKEICDAIDDKPSLTAANAFTTGVQDFNRIGGTQGGAVVAGDFALSAGFGTTASVAVTSGSRDGRGEITVTSAGTGQGASPTITFTFHDGTWTSVPFGGAWRSGGSQRTVNVDVAFTATTMTITFLGTPVAAETYKIQWSVEK